MSVQTQIDRISGNIAGALQAVAAKGITVPSGATSDDLPGLIGKIEAGGGSVNLTLIDDAGDGFCYATPDGDLVITTQGTHTVDVAGGVIIANLDAQPNAYVIANGTYNVKTWPKYALTEIYCFTEDGGNARLTFNDDGV